jgi:hypothetical protein
LKNPSQKRAGRVDYGVGPEFKPQYPIKKDELYLIKIKNFSLPKEKEKKRKESPF